MNTFLEEFFSNKLSAHNEPTRKKTPRGNRIGFGKIKYSAALISTLTNINLKKVAKNVNGNYGVVRVWRSQADFKDCCNSIADEFIFFMDCELEDVAVRLAEDFRNERFPDHEELFERFKDSDTYNKNIISHIAEKLNHYINDFPNGDVAFHNMVYYLAKYSNAPKLIEILDQLQARLREHLLIQAIETLQQPELSDWEKGGVIIKLKRLIA